jgi:ribonuclease E
MASNEIEIVEVEINRDNAVLLLDAAYQLHRHESVVETTSEGVFRVPRDVAEKAGLAKKGAEKSASDKQVEKVTAEGDPYGDPLAEDRPEREASSNTIHTAQADAELAQRQSDTKSGRSQTAKKTAAKRAPAKKAAAKKAAASNDSKE